MFGNFIRLDLDMSEAYHADDVFRVLTSLKGLTAGSHAKWAMLIRSVFAIREHVYNKFMRFDERVCYMDVLKWTLQMDIIRKECNSNLGIAIGTPRELINLQERGSWYVIPHQNSERLTQNTHIPLIFHTENKNHCIVTYFSDGRMDLLYDPMTTR